MKSNPENTIAIYKVKNDKEYKYMEKALGEFEEVGDNSFVPNLLGKCVFEDGDNEEVSRTLVKLEYLEKVVKLARGSNTESVQIVMPKSPSWTDDRIFPVFFFRKDGEFNGLSVIAPLLPEDLEARHFEKEKSKEIVSICV